MGNDSNPHHDFIPIKYIPYFVWLIFISVVGTLGNTLIIFSVILNKNLQKTSNIFLVNLAVADIIVTSIIDPFAAVGLINNADFFTNHPLLCLVLGVVVIFCCAWSTWLIAAISLERYLHICYPYLYQKIFTAQTTPYIVIALWLIAGIVTLPNLAIGGYPYYIERELICNYDFSDTYLVLISVACGVFIPMLIILFCYFGIYSALRQSKQRMLQYNNNINGAAIRHLRTADTKTVKTIATIWIVYLIMWGPNGLLYAHKQWPNSYIRTSIALGLSNSSINFIIYGIMNKNFSRSYKMICRKICCISCRCGVITGSISAEDSTGSNTGMSPKGNIPALYLNERSRPVINRQNHDDSMDTEITSGTTL